MRFWELRLVRLFKQMMNGYRCQLINLSPMTMEMTTMTGGKRRPLFSVDYLGLHGRMIFHYGNFQYFVIGILRRRLEKLDRKAVSWAPSSIVGLASWQRSMSPG